VTKNELGAGTTVPHDARGLVKFPNPIRCGDVIDLVVPEFTCFCPVTGQPDFAMIRIRYVPDQHCIETKSLKLYMWHFRDRKAFHEAVTREICDALVACLEPTWMQVLGEFGVRGGITEKVLAEHFGDNPAPAPVIDRYSFQL
jgi:7-cyano-7-deazaguanine reductase